MSFHRKFWVYLLLLEMIFQITTVCYCLDSVIITPSEPQKGDEMIFNVTGKPFEHLDVDIEYSRNIETINGQYSWRFNNIKLFEEESKITISASEVSLLRVSVSIGGVPITESKLGIGGKAAISRSNLLGDISWVEVSGNTQEDTQFVTISITAETSIILNEEGSYSFEYDTEEIPSGEFKIQVGDILKKVVIKDQINLENIQPIIHIKDNKTLVTGKLVYFEASETNDPTGLISEYIWDLGDGYKSQGIKIQHRYLEPGKYLVKLTITDSKGNEVSTNSSITVQNPTTNNLQVISNESPSSATIKQNVKISILVLNQGDMDISSFQVEAYDKTVLINQKIIEHLASNQSTWINFTWKPQETGSRELRFILDPEDKIHENNESDNTYIVRIMVKPRYNKTLTLIMITLALAVLILLIKSKYITARAQPYT